jgi:N-methylhydantoinase A
MGLAANRDGETEDQFIQPWHIGVDVGGTFTDVALIDSRGALSCFKSPSRPDHPAAGIIDALESSSRALGLTINQLLAGCALFVHGTTVATNTLIEGDGAKVGLLTTKGFRDALEIRRGYRRHPFDHRTPYPPVLVPRYLRLPVSERIDRNGHAFEQLDPGSVVSALEVFKAEGVESIAICFLNSYINDDHEQKAATIVRAQMPQSWVSVSSDVAPIAGEYARVSTTVVDAYVAPRLVAYLHELEERLAGLGLAAPLLLVKNNGGTVTVEEVSTAPVAITLSGPAAAIGGLGQVSGHIESNNLISVEIGGTSCDVVMMKDGEVALTDSLSISDYDLAITSADVHTVGAGGGTIAGVDKAGLLFVGPRGAGAHPGPVCYGHGGTEPTVTDAQVVLGRLRPGAYASGKLTIDAKLAETAIKEKIAEPLGLSTKEAAAGIIRVMEQNVLHAVSYISVQRGIDPRNFVLVAGGGAGGLHVAVVGRLLEIPRVYVPRLGGVFCALGMLNSDIRHDVVRSYIQSTAQAVPHTIDDNMDELLEEVRAVLDREGFRGEDAYFEREIDLRYEEQQWDVRVRLPATGQWDWSSVRSDFEKEYDRLFGHVQPEAPLEVVKLRLTGYGRISIPQPAEGRTADHPPEPYEIRPVYMDPENDERETPIYRGQDLFFGHALQGPLIIEEETTTILVGPRDRLSVDRAGNYMIDLRKENSTS